MITILLRFTRCQLPGSLEADFDALEHDLYVTRSRSQSHHNSQYLTISIMTPHAKASSSIQYVTPPKAHPFHRVPAPPYPAIPTKNNQPLKKTNPTKTKKRANTHSSLPNSAKPQHDMTNLSKSRRADMGRTWPPRASASYTSGVGIE